MPTVLILIFAFFVLMIIGFGIAMYVDSRTLLVGPSKYQLSDGTAEGSSETVTVFHEEDPATGTLIAKALLSGNGKGCASARMGHSFTPKKAKKRHAYKVIFDFDYRAVLRVNEGAGKAAATITGSVRKKTQDFIAEERSELGTTTLPEGGEMKNIKHKFEFELEPDESADVILTLDAVAESDTGASCETEVNAKLREIIFQPKVLF